MREFFVIANSFAAPFFSDESSEFVEAETPEEALTSFAEEYKHPCGLYAAAAYQSADAFHKGQEPLVRWASNHELARQKATQDKEAHSYLGHAPGVFEIDHKVIELASPKAGRVVPV